MPDILPDPRFSSLRTGGIQIAGLPNIPGINVSPSVATVNPGLDAGAIPQSTIPQTALGTAVQTPQVTVDPATREATVTGGVQTPKEFTGVSDFFNNIGPENYLSGAQAVLAAGNVSPIQAVTEMLIGLQKPEIERKKLADERAHELALKKAGIKPTKPTKPGYVEYVDRETGEITGFQVETSEGVTWTDPQGNPMNSAPENSILGSIYSKPELSPGDKKFQEAESSRQSTRKGLYLTENKASLGAINTARRLVELSRSDPKAFGKTQNLSNFFVNVADEFVDVGLIAPGWKGQANTSAEIKARGESAVVTQLEKLSGNPSDKDLQLIRNATGDVEELNAEQAATVYSASLRIQRASIIANNREIDSIDESQGNPARGKELTKVPPLDVNYFNNLDPEEFKNPDKYSEEDYRVLRSSAREKPDDFVYWYTTTGLTKDQAEEKLIELDKHFGIEEDI